MMNTDCRYVAADASYYYTNTGKKTKTIVCIMVELLSAPDINEEANGQANLYSVLYVLV